MPIIPQYTTAVLLFGEDACRRSNELIETMGLALENDAWADFVFLRAYPQGVTLPPVQVNYPLNGYDAPYTAAHVQGGAAPVSPQVLAALASRLNDRPLQIHCFCSGTPENPIPGDLPARYAAAVAARFQAKMVRVYFHVVLLEEAPGAIGPQQQLAQAICVPPTYAAYTPFIYSHTYNTGTAVEDAQLWRAMTWTMLASCENALNVEADRVYTLGYSGINANNNELADLRLHKVKSRFRALVDRRISPQHAWQLLTGGQEIAGSDPMDLTHVTACTQRWLYALADAALPRPDAGRGELSQIRILTRTKDPEDVVKALCAFYGCNTAIPLDEEQAQDMRYPAVHARRSILQQLQRHLEETLLCLPEVEQFPLNVADQLLSALRRIEREDLPAIQTPDWHGKRLFQSRDSFLDGCFLQAEEAVREHYVHLFCRQIAPDLYRMYEQVSEMLKRICKDSELSQLLMDDRRVPLKELKAKYPDYWMDIEEEMSQRTDLFGNSWERDAITIVDRARGARPLYTRAGDVDRKEVQRLISRGMAAYGPGISRSFIRVIMDQNDIAEEMNAFINAHISAGKAMYCAYGNLSYGELRHYHFIDQHLRSHPWTNGQHGGSCFIIDNDNVERVTLYRVNITGPAAAAQGAAAVKTTLKDLLQGVAGVFNDPLSAAGAAGMGMGGTATAWGAAGKPDTPPVRQAPAVRVQPPRFTRTMSADGRTLTLRWTWPEGAESVQCAINGGERISYDQSKMGTLSMNSDKTAGMCYGGNHVAVYRLGEETPWLEGCMPGFMYPVTVQLGSDTLTAEVPPRSDGRRKAYRPEADGRAWEQDEELQLALLVRRHGAAEGDAWLLYPMALEQGANGQRRLPPNRFEGLTHLNLNRAEVVHSPNYRFPTLVCRSTLRV